MNRRLAGIGGRFAAGRQAEILGEIETRQNSLGGRCVRLPVEGKACRVMQGRQKRLEQNGDQREP